MNTLRLSLKVCEACGVLWLRGEVSDGVYCRGCAVRLAQFPAPKGRHAGGRKPGSVRSTPPASRRARTTGCATAAFAGGAR